MAAASQKSIVNAKGKYLQDATGDVKFGAERGAAIWSNREASDMRTALTKSGTAGLTVVAAPQAAVDRLAKAKAKSDKAKAKAKAAAK